MIPLEFTELPENEMINRSSNFNQHFQKRRTVRDFSNKIVPEEIIINSVQAAAAAPSGANLQPWHFVIVSDLKIKHEIRVAAEKEEKEFYKSKAPEEWLEALTPLGTNEHKPFLDTAPHLIVLFEKKYEILDSGEKQKLYYTKESVGIACGVLITALHQSGLSTLTYTPSPMNFLNHILKRPENEKPFLLLVVGYPVDGCTVPDIKRKTFSQIATIIK